MTLQERKENLFEKFPLWDLDMDRIKGVMSTTYNLYMEAMSNITSGLTLNDKSLFDTGEKQYIAMYREARNSERLWSINKRREHDQEASKIYDRIALVKSRLIQNENEEISLKKRLFGLQGAIITDRTELEKCELEAKRFSEKWKELKENGFLQRQ